MQQNIEKVIGLSQFAKFKNEEITEVDMYFNQLPLLHDIIKFTSLTSIKYYNDELYFEIVSIGEKMILKNVTELFISLEKPH